MIPKNVYAIHRWRHYVKRRRITIICVTRRQLGPFFSGSEINLYLQSFKLGYGTESREGITTKPNTLNNDKDYVVCANLKNILRHHKKTRKRKSARLDPQARKKLYGWYKSCHRSVGWCKKRLTRRILYISQGTCNKYIWWWWWWWWWWCCRGGDGGEGEK